MLAVTSDELGPRGVPIVNGVYADGSQEAARLARMAAEGGAAALLVFPPGPFALDQNAEMALAHLRRVADAAPDLPIILFQYPMASGQGYPLPTLLRLFEAVPAIRAIKDWCNDVRLHERHVRALHALSPRVNVLSTHSAWLLPSLVLGCDGLLSGAGSVIADLQARLFRAVQADDLPEARRLYDRIHPITEAFYAEPFVDMHNRMKEALGAARPAAGSARAPAFGQARARGGRAHPNGPGCWRPARRRGSRAATGRLIVDRPPSAFSPKRPVPQTRTAWTARRSRHSGRKSWRRAAR